MSRPRTFKQTKIAMTGDIPDKDKIPNWIKHAGGKYSISKELEDDVTHLIVSKNDWCGYKPIGRAQNAVKIQLLTFETVKKARQKGTVFLVKPMWLIDSMCVNKSRLCDETLKKYAWEPEHARRVSKRRKALQREINKAKRAAKASERVTIWTDGESGDPGFDNIGQIKDKSARDVKKQVQRVKPVRRRTTSTKVDQMIEAGPLSRLGFHTGMLTLISRHKIGQRTLDQGERHGIALVRHPRSFALYTDCEQEGIGPMWTMMVCHI